MMQPLLYAQTLEGSSAKRSRQLSDTSALQSSFGPGTDYCSFTTNSRGLHAADVLTRELDHAVPLPVQGFTHFPHGVHSQSDSIALHGQDYADVQPLNAAGSKRSYSAANTISAFDAERSAQKLAYQALLERLPVNPTQRSIMCAYLRDELREILRFNRLSYHKSGSDNKVIPQINTPRHTPCCVRLFDFSGRL